MEKCTGGDVTVFLENKKIVLFFLLDEHADWETGYASAKLHNLGYTVRTISLKVQSVKSQGEFLTSVYYSLDTFHDQNLAALLLIGGSGWGDQHLIKGYDRNLYDENASRGIKEFIEHSLSVHNNKNRLMICQPVFVFKDFLLHFDLL